MWRYIFLIHGSVTVLLFIIVVLALPDSAAKAWFLNVSYRVKARWISHSSNLHRGQTNASPGLGRNDDDRPSAFISLSLLCSGPPPCAPAISRFSRPQKNDATMTSMPVHRDSYRSLSTACQPGDFAIQTTFWGGGADGVEMLAVGSHRRLTAAKACRACRTELCGKRGWAQLERFAGAKHRALPGDREIGRWRCLQVGRS